MSASINPATRRDQRIGQRLAYTGAARILAEAEQCLSNRERIARWRVITARLPLETSMSPCATHAPRNLEKSQ